jgi:tripartite-type tricarboxylate transporter receptor subunit TctC
MLKQLRSFAALTGVAGLAAMALPGSAAAEYPEKPITIVVSASVGGSIDALTRQLAPFWEKTLGQKINIENKDGAGGITGVRYFMEQPDDGYTILIATQAHYQAAVEKSDTLKTGDVAVINMQQFTPTAWFVLDSSPYKSFEDLYKAAMDKPDTITYGCPTTGNTMISAGVVTKEWKANMRFVPQEGGAETDTALLGGHIDVKIGTAGDITELKGVRAIAVAAADRQSFLPDTPTFDEISAKLGLSKMPYVGTGRIVAVRVGVKDSHPEIFQKLAESYKAAFHDPEYQKLLESSGQALSTMFNEPDVATGMFQQLVDDSIKYKKLYASN